MQIEMTLEWGIEREKVYWHFTTLTSYANAYLYFVRAMWHFACEIIVLLGAISIRNVDFDRIQFVNIRLARIFFPLQMFRSLVIRSVTLTRIGWKSGHNLLINIRNNDDDNKEHCMLETKKYTTPKSVSA